jgi:hypothetical protein
VPQEKPKIILQAFKIYLLSLQNVHLNHLQYHILAYIASIGKPKIVNMGHVPLPIHTQFFSLYNTSHIQLSLLLRSLNFLVDDFYQRQ